MVIVIVVQMTIICMQMLPYNDQGPESEWTIPQKVCLELINT